MPKRDDFEEYVKAMSDVIGIKPPTSPLFEAVTGRRRMRIAEPQPIPCEDNHTLSRRFHAHLAGVNSGYLVVDDHMHADIDLGPAGKDFFLDLAESKRRPWLTVEAISGRPVTLAVMRTMCNFDDITRLPPGWDFDYASMERRMLDAMRAEWPSR